MTEDQSKKEIKPIKTFVFGIGAITGNLTELGVSRLPSNVSVNRHLFKDINGDPTIITVRKDESIRIPIEEERNKPSDNELYKIREDAILHEKIFEGTDKSYWHSLVIFTNI